MLTYISQAVSSSLQVSSIQISLAVCVGLYVLYYNSRSWNKKLPPGPRTLPFIGNLLELSKSAYPPGLFCEWRKKYGDVFMVKIGHRPAVVVSGYKAVREALVTKQNDFADRPRLYTMDVFTDCGKNIGFADFGPVWQLQRKLAHQAFRKFASGDHLEVLLNVAAERLFVKLDTAFQNQKAVRPVELLTAFTADLQNVMCFGLDILEKDDPLFDAVQKGFISIDEKLGRGMVADFFPWFRHVYKIYKTQTLTEIHEFMDLFEEYLKKVMKEKKRDFNEDRISEITSMLISVQKEYEVESRTSGSGMPKLSDEHFLYILRDIFGAGTDTSRFTLTWFVQFMALHPEIQDQLYEEIVSNVGKDHKITLDDRLNLPLVEATLYEVMRCRTIIALGLPHATTCDTTCMGYDIPAGTMMFPNILSCHTDPEYWTDPDQFRPERFINPDGSASMQRDSYLPFSAGRRVCIGESLVKTTLTFTLASLMQRYKFHPVPGENLTLDVAYSFLATEPKPFKVMVELRH